MKKLMLFASLAMAAAAFAVPSTASAFWTNGGVDIPAGTNPQLHGVGFASFTSEIGGVNCSSNVTATLQLTGGSGGAGGTTAHAQQFNPTVANCKGTGALAGCTINSITTSGYPWTGHTTAAGIVTQTGVQIQNHLSGFLCPPTLQLDTDAQHHVTLQPVNTAGTGNRQAITALHIGGTLFITETKSTANAAGTITATAADSHKYGWT